MHLIIGGKYMGKLAYARKLYGGHIAICDLSISEPDSITHAAIVTNLQDGVRTLMKQGINVREFFDLHLKEHRNSILIGDEIGSGLVPMEPFERAWRDETGFLYQTLAQEADIVDRIWAGLATRL